MTSSTATAHLAVSDLELGLKSPAGVSDQPTDGDSQVSASANHTPRRFTERLVALRAGVESGMATAEYAIATLAAAGFAGLLLLILRSDEVRQFLLNIIRQALSVVG